MTSALVLAVRLTRRCGLRLAGRQWKPTPRALLAALLLFGLGSASHAGGVVPLSADAELRDQHGRTHVVAAMRGEVTVVMVVTASRLRNLRAWQATLQEDFADVRFVLVADVPTSPAVTWERVSEKLVRRVPEEVPVLIDLERSWADELDLDTDRPNVLLLDRQGSLAARFRGLQSDVLAAEVGAKLRELLER